MYKELDNNKMGGGMNLIFNRVRQTALWVAVACALVIGLIFLISARYQKIVYAERKQMLSMVINSAAQTFKKTVESEWDVYNLSYSIVAANLEVSKDISECITNVNIQHDFGTDYYFLVDEDGKYYSSDGVHGKLIDFTHYKKSSAERVEYLSTLPHLNPRKAFMIYRGSFDQPIRINTDSGMKYIVYFAYAQDLTALKNAIGGMFKGSSNIFIYDKKGSMLYEDYGIKMLIEGHNIYKKFYLCKMPFGEKAEAMIRKCEMGEDVVVGLDINDQDYYFCSVPINISGWSLAMIIEQQAMDRTLARSIWILVLYIVLIIIVIGGTLLIISYSVMSKAQEARLSESRQLADAMAETSRAKTVFLSNMSHDIRTPINGIMGVTTIARGVVDNPAKVTACLDKIDTASHHLLSLINDVLDMSRIESGKTKITTEAVNILDICNNCSGIIKGQLADRKLKFITEFAVEHPEVFADEVHLRRVFINILGNAVKFTRDGGRILFRCKETSCTDEKVELKFEVKDTGIGMSKQFIGRIFDSFAQEENRERSNYVGTGLGMSITKQIVDLMGGTIEVESEVNKGSSFVVTLSLDRNLGQQTVSVEESSDANIEGVRILLVEDNELNMEIAETLLTGSGAKVDRAWDGLEAIDRFTANDIGTYDVILMDLMMPRMDGFEATKAIRNLKREDALTIPIIAMTANAFEDDIRATEEAGMNAHLSKPIDMEVVIRTIASFVNKQ